jgi:tail tube GTA-gp10-like protein
VSVELNWVGGEHVFAFNIGQIEALQKLTGEGPGSSLKRLYLSLQEKSPMLGPWLTKDVFDVVRLGLVGGGMEIIDARKLVAETVERVGIEPLIAVAADVLLNGLETKGAEDSYEDDPEETHYEKWDLDGMISAGAVMGFTPEQTRKMSIEDFYVVASAIAKSNGAKPNAKAVSDEELQQLGIEGA